MRGDALRSLQVQVTQRLHGSSLEIQGEDMLMRAAFQVQGSRQRVMSQMSALLRLRKQPPRQRLRSAHDLLLEHYHTNAVENVLNVSTCMFPIISSLEGICIGRQSGSQHQPPGPPPPESQREPLRQSRGVGCRLMASSLRLHTGLAALAI